MKKIFLLLSILLSLSISAQEVVDSGNLIQGGLRDGEKLLGAYITPLNKAIVYGLSNLTYSKLRSPKDEARFIISLKMAYVGVPDEDLTYDVSKLDLEYIEAKDPNNTIAQTVFGDSLSSIVLASKKKDLLGRRLFEFNSPVGGQSNALPLPYVGFDYRMKSTNLSFGVIPYLTIPTSDLKVGMLQTSLQQDIMSLINSSEEKTAYGISLQASAGVLYAHAPLHVSPDGVYVPISFTGSLTGPYDDQNLDVVYTSFQIGAYAHYTLIKKLNLFAGAGYNFGSSRIFLTGKYPVYTSDPSGSASVVAEDIVDPLDMSDDFSRFKYDFGARMDWDKFYLQANYNMATYGGLGVSFGYKL